MQKELLGTCDYCCNTGRKRNLAKVTWKTDNRSNVYCPYCLPIVEDNVKDLPWVQKDGYIIEYPWRNTSSRD